MRILFTILLIVWLKKVGFVLMIWKKKKNVLTEELWWLKKMMKISNFSSKCCICDDVYVNGDVKVILSYQSKI